MSIKSELKVLLKDSYAVINELQTAADIANVKKELIKQSHQTIDRLTELSIYLHEIVDSFSMRAKDTVDTITSCKIKTLDGHSVELLQCLEYLSKMCVITEDLLKLQDNSAEFLDFAPKFKQELSTGLRDCKDLNQIDYGMFASLDLEIDTSWLFKTHFLSIISKSSQTGSHSELCTFGFEDVGNSKNFTCQMSNNGTGVETDSGHASPSHEREIKCETDSFLHQNALGSIPEEFEEQMETSFHKSELNKTSDNDRRSASQANCNQSYSLKVGKSPKVHNMQDVTLEEDLLTESLESMKIVNGKRNGTGSANKTISCHRNQSEYSASGKDRELSCVDFGDHQSMSKSDVKENSDRPEENNLVGPAFKSSNYDSDMPTCSRGISDNMNKEFVAECDPYKKIAPNIPTKTQMQNGTISSKEKRIDETLLHQAPKLESCVSETTETIEKVHSLSPQRVSATAIPEDEAKPHINMLDKLKPLLTKCSQNADGALSRRDSESLDALCEGLPPSGPRSRGDILGLESKSVSSTPKISDNQEGEVATYPSKKIESASGNLQSREEITGKDNQKNQAQMIHSQINPNTIPDISKPTMVPLFGKVGLETQFDTATPLDMFFNLESAMIWNKQGMAEINAVFKEKITGDSCAFKFPIGCCLLKDGRLVVADTGNHVVKILRRNKLLKTIGKDDGITFLRPSAVASDSNDNLYIKDDICVQIFNSEGNRTKTIGMQIFKFPFGIALANVPERGPALFVLETNVRCPKLFRYLIREDKLQSCEYQPALRFGSARSKLRFFAIHKDKVLASDLGASTMYLSDLYGQALRRFGSIGYQNGQFVEPSGVTVDRNGYWLVADSRNDRVQVFSNEGDFVGHIKFSQPIRRPSGIHLSSDGTLYVINFIDHCIHVYSLRK
ncbi:hypothetical protein EGW08_012059 [Elysia chlorotica]|uniref:SMP-30/Gluconolactonase/LRE-like region domain-containing protein n=1 Tax=Elysia chlorotica TaxID=188477 RepID=A0A3S1A197_ELYCH|nr:hypothetical protein EGW08_012059 [Elysia chlorotica]